MTFETASIAAAEAGMFDELFAKVCVMAILAYGIKLRVIANWFFT